MKGRITLFTLFLALLVSFQLKVEAQNMVVNGDMEVWTNTTTPQGYDKAESLTQESVVVHSGNYSAKQNAGTKDIQQIISGIVPGVTYTISYWYLDNDPDAKSRMWSYWLNGSSYVYDNATELRPSTANYSTDSPNWVQYSVTIEAPANVDGLQFEVRTYNDNNDDGDVYYDDFSVVAQVSSYCSEILEFSLPSEVAPAVIDTVNNTITIEVYNGTDLTQLVPTFTLCDFSNVIDTSSFSIITSGVDVVDFSSPVIWQVISEVPAQFYEITVTESTIAAPSIVINEFDYDQPSTDDAEFIELYNNGTVAVNLLGMQLQLVNGNGNSVYANYNLPDTTLQPGEFYVICADPTTVPDCDLAVISSIQNGPDAIALLDASSVIMDVVSYEGDVAGYVEGSATVSDSDSPLLGLSRIPNGNDTDDNNADFGRACITPGDTNVNDPGPCVCEVGWITRDSIGECDPVDGTFEYFLIVEYGAEPATGFLVVNGEDFPITGSPQEVTVSGVPSNGDLLDLNIYFSDMPDCDRNLYNFIQAPPPCIDCVEDVYVDAVGQCEGQNNTYTASFMFEPVLSDPGYWVVEVQNVIDTIYWDGQTPGTATLSGLFSTGMPVTVAMYPLVDPACVSIFDTVWYAPQNCYTLAELVINEVDYDMPGGDDAEFIELKNNSAYPLKLQDYELQLINGSNAFIYDNIYLPDVMLAPGDYFVLCGDPNNTSNCDMDLSEHRNNYNSLFSIQNGSPDAIALFSPFGDTLDRLSYEGSEPPFVEVSGSNLEDDSDFEGNGLSRYPDGVDTDDNNSDFEFKCITPGESNSYLSGYCGPFHTGTFNVFYENTGQTLMPNVELTLMLDGQVAAVDTTDASGVVVFDSLHSDYYQLLINPFAYEWGWGGVNGRDALLIALHTVEYINLASPYVEAGDVSDDGAVNTTDALQVIRRFAGVQIGFNAGDWYPEAMNLNIDFATASSFNEDVGLLNFGDVDGSHIPTSTLKSSETQILRKGQLMAESGINIPVYVEHAVELGAASIALRLPTGMNVEGVIMADESTPVYSLNDGVLLLSWFSLDPMMLAAGEPLMTIQASNAMTADGSFELLPGTEFGNAMGEKISVSNLIIPGLADASASISAYPNPANQSVTMNYAIPESGNVEIEITDMLGARVQLVESAHQTAGNHVLEVNLSNLAEGTYIINLKGENFRTSNRLVIVK